MRRQIEFQLPLVDLELRQVAAEKIDGLGRLDRAKGAQRQMRRPAGGLQQADPKAGRLPRFLQRLPAGGDDAARAEVHQPTAAARGGSRHAGHDNAGHEQSERLVQRMLHINADAQAEFAPPLASRHSRARAMWRRSTVSAA